MIGLLLLVFILLQRGLLKLSQGRLSGGRMTSFHPRICELGEGLFWHPGRGQFFWFDILSRRLLAQGGAEWRFDRMASAAGRVDARLLLLATETGLALLDLQTGTPVDHVAVDTDRPAIRSNDGRADRQGGFWFGAIGKRAEPGAGAIYRYYRGRVERLFGGLSILNAIGFAPDGRLAYFADTARQRVWAQPLDGEGWLEGGRRVFLDLAPEGLNPTARRRTARAGCGSPNGAPAR